MPILETILGSGIVNAALKLIDKVIPDPQAKQAAQLEILRMQQAGEFKAMEADLQLALAQIDVNKTEASGSWFSSGWRPSVGWTCSIGLFYQFLIRPFVTWIGPVMLPDVAPPPSLELGTLITLLFGMLGLGTMRTVERNAGKIPPGK